MKMMKFQFRFLLLTLLCSFVLFSCNKENIIDPDNGLQLQTNEQEFTRLINARTSYTGKSFEIIKVEKVGDMLKIEVEGGCDEANYKIVWNGVFMQSYPEQTGLVVTYAGSKEESCGSKRHTLVIDMEKLFGKADLIVHVSNGSKVADVSVDPNGTVTNKP